MFTFSQLGTKKSVLVSKTSLPNVPITLPQFSLSLLLSMESTSHIWRNSPIQLICNDSRYWLFSKGTVIPTVIISNGSVAIISSFSYLWFAFSNYLFDIVLYKRPVIFFFGRFCSIFYPHMPLKLHFHLYVHHLCETLLAYPIFQIRPSKCNTVTYWAITVD